MSFMCDGEYALSQGDSQFSFVSRNLNRRVIVSHWESLFGNKSSGNPSIEALLREATATAYQETKWHKMDHSLPKQKRLSL